MWKLKDKNRQYFEENAPSVLNLTNQAEQSAVEPGTFKPADKTKLMKKEKLRDLQNQL